MCVRMCETALPALHLPSPPGLGRWEGRRGWGGELRAALMSVSGAPWGPWMQSFVRGLGRPLDVCLLFSQFGDASSFRRPWSLPWGRASAGGAEGLWGRC